MYGGDNGQASSANLYFPGLMAFNKDCSIMYFAEQGNQRVRKIVMSTTIISTLAGSTWATSNFVANGAFTADGGQATSAKLNYPCGVAVDSSGNVYFSEIYNARVRKVSTSGILTTFAGVGSTSFNSPSSYGTYR